MRTRDGIGLGLAATRARNMLGDQRARAGALAVATLACWAVTVAGLLVFPPSGIALAALATLTTTSWRRSRRAVDAISRADARAALPEGW
jgi:hypothetical protein